MIEYEIRQKHLSYYSAFFSNLCKSGRLLSLIFLFSLLSITGAHAGDRLKTGQYLTPGQSLFSKNGKVQLILQRDGNLVIYKSREALWSTNTVNKGATKLTMQSDGNLVLYNGNKPLWHTETHYYNGQGVRAVIQNNGRVVLSTSRGDTVWASKKHLGSVHHAYHGDDIAFVSSAVGEAGVCDKERDGATVYAEVWYSSLRGSKKVYTPGDNKCTAFTTWSLSAYRVCEEPGDRKRTTCGRKVSIK